MANRIEQRIAGESQLPQGTRLLPQVAEYSFIAGFMLKLMFIDELEHANRLIVAVNIFYIQSSYRTALHVLTGGSISNAETVRFRLLKTL